MTKKMSKVLEALGLKTTDPPTLARAIRNYNTSEGAKSQIVFTPCPNHLCLCHNKHIHGIVQVGGLQIDAYSIYLTVESLDDAIRDGKIEVEMAIAVLRFCMEKGIMFA